MENSEVFPLRSVAVVTILSERPTTTAGVKVNVALSELPELHRMAVTLRYFEELDYATIEQTLGLSNGALRGILGRALGVMRRRLKPALATIA